jgi:predicted phage-related endonuclease
MTTTTIITVTEASVALDPSAEALIVEFNTAKAAIKAFEAKKAAAEAALRAALGNASVGTINGVERVRVNHRNRSNIDREALKAAFPEAYAATLTETAYTVLQAK